MRIQPTSNMRQRTYTGPAKPIRLRIRNTDINELGHSRWDTFVRVVFLLALMCIVALDLFYWRPN